MKKFLTILIIIISTVSYSQDIKLNKEETLEYIRNKILDARTHPHDETIQDYIVRLEYDYLILETFPKDSPSHEIKVKLKDSDINYKFNEYKYYRIPGFGNGRTGGYTVYIRGENLPPFVFDDVEDAKRVVNALEHLQKYCKKDPFD